MVHMYSFDFQSSGADIRGRFTKTEDFLTEFCRAFFLLHSHSLIIGAHQRATETSE